MITDWTTQCERLLSLLRDQGPLPFYEPTILELLVDLRDKSPREFARFRLALKAVRAATDIEKSMKEHGYRDLPAQLPGHGVATERARVQLTNDLMTVGTEILSHAVKHPQFYVQASRPVRVVPLDGRAVPAVREFCVASMTEFLSSVVFLFVLKERKGQAIEVEVSFPRVVVEAILARGHYPGARIIRGITSGPIVRPDGSIFVTTGYDELSGYFCAYNAGDLVVPDAPTREDALRSLGAITDIVADFPFKEPMHRSAWLALALTLLLRPSINGNTPTFLITANIQGSGKTLLAQAASAMVYGDVLPGQPYSDENKEQAASLSALFAEGAPAVLFDNVVGQFGGATFDQVATLGRLRSRLYGSNTVNVEVDANAVLIVTGNNLTGRTDLPRRAIVCILESDRERPEARTDIRFPNLLHEVSVRRSALLSSLLTMVRAYVIAERPRPTQAPLGSFEPWSHAVRDLLVWLGEADAVETQAYLREEQDAPLIALLSAWEKMFGLNKPVTINEAVDAIERAERALKDSSSSMAIDLFNRNDSEHRVIPAKALEGALKDLGMVSLASVNAVSLGKKFRQFVKKRCNGRMFDSVTRENTNAWMVVAADGSGEAVAPAKPANDNVRRRAR